MKTLVIFLGLIFFQVAAFSQDDSTQVSEQLYVVTKIDGKEYIGKILSDDGREVLIETKELGKIYIPKSDIKSMIKLEDQDDIVYGEYRNEGPFTTRYAFTTNALPIKRGENYAMINLYGPEMHFAVADNFNIGLMSTWIASPMALAMKYSIKTKNEKVNVSLGTLIGSSGYIRNFQGFGGLHFGNVTLGDRKNNLTLSAGYAYYKSGRKDYNYTEPGVYYSNSSYYYNWNYNTSAPDRPMVQGPVFSIAGKASVGKTASFIFDSMVGIFSTTGQKVDVTQADPSTGFQYQHTVSNVKTSVVALFVMPGVRIQTTERKAFQISMAGISFFNVKNPVTGGRDNFSMPFPMCSWFYKF